MVERTTKTKDCGDILDEHILENYSGGIGSGYNALPRLRVKCPVEGCGFECNTFGEMNTHMHQLHSALC